ncbi:M24 family metallopeptidase [Aquicoccus sp. SCR17]|nr:M24 family metallopeptidase [Carideicomes alvinocaridis]
MFQSFEETADPGKGPDRLEALRAEMRREGLDGYLVPRADAHQGEYVAECDARLAWLTGFTGSAGFCAALMDRAGVFVDSRYRVQVKSQVADVFTPVDWPEVTLAAWLGEHMNEGAVLGLDPWLHTVDEVARLTAALERQRISLKPLDENLVDRIWPDRPAPPRNPVTPFPAEIAGLTAAEKRALCAEDLRESGEDAVVLSLPDSICWLLNIRGTDIPRNPVAQGFAVLQSDGRVDLFIDPERLQDVALDEAVTTHPIAGFAAALAGLTGRVRIDPKSAPQAVADLLQAAEISHGDDPCLMPKACKTEAEIAATSEAHLRDAAAMCEFLAWLDAQEPASLTEIDVVTALEGFRRATNALRDISFDTICGAGPHGAIVHYRVTEGTNRALQEGELLLVDSGGQYEDGTTDITRTVALGEVEEEPRVNFTRVLQGMIAVSRLRWPRGLAGRELESVARLPLWRAGLDYGHGTGHGVGVYLSVHEGPARLSRTSDVPLRPGMILSNEPGFYREGAYGIRIENLLVVREAPELPGATVKEMLDFATLTWVPIDRRLILPGLMSREEIEWLDRYHAEVLRLVRPRLGKQTALWLDEACAPILDSERAV